MTRNSSKVFPFHIVSIDPYSIGKGNMAVYRAGYTTKVAAKRNLEMFAKSEMDKAHLLCTDYGNTSRGTDELVVLSAAVIGRFWLDYSVDYGKSITVGELSNRVVDAYIQEDYRLLPLFAGCFANMGN